MLYCIRPSVIIIISVGVLQSGLDKLNEWKLGIAINKCSILNISKNNPQHSNYNLQSDYSAIETTDLGIIVEFKLRFSTHC